MSDLVMTPPAMTLADIVGDIESGNDQFAMRFEPAVYREWPEAEWVSGEFQPKIRIAKKIAAANRCNYHTAVMIAATSWGRFQIMGENIYQRFNDSVFVWMASNSDQLTTFTGYCADRHIAFTPLELVEDAGKRATFAREYNGPAAIADYASKILAAAKRIAAVKSLAADPVQASFDREGL